MTEYIPVGKTERVNTFAYSRNVLKCMIPVEFEIRLLNLMPPYIVILETHDKLEEPVKGKIAEYFGVELRTL